MIEFRLPGASVFFSDRRGGVSVGPYRSLNVGALTDDESAHVVENRRRLARAAGLAPARVAMGWQVHGADLRDWEAAPVEAGFARPGAELPRVDGHLTSVTGLGLLVVVADCYPVALSDGSRVAILHCGWRGLAAGIVERALARFDSVPAAAVGPGIGGCCYVVGPEVRSAFADLERVTDGDRLDLRAVIAHKLEAAGVGEVAHARHCTSCRGDRYFSHRRDRGLTGRQAGLVTLDA